VTKKRRARKSRLAPEDWADAALDALLEGGLGAVTVERLARELGVTKGSFYWHFEDRAGLVAAAVARFEEVALATISEARQCGSDAEQLAHLATHMLGDERDARAELVLAGAAHHASIATSLARIAGARIAWLAELLTRRGAPNVQARAVLANAALLGVLQLRAVAPELAPEAIIATWIEDLLGTN
jgi:AcrR family transcriptional regulator